MFVSTRGAVAVRGARAVLDGLAPDGGLYVPLELPRLDPSLYGGAELSYAELGLEVLSPFFPEIPRPALAEALTSAAALFPSDPAPLVQAGGRAFLELFHGPTLAFKDFALSLLGDLVRLSSEAEAAADPGNAPARERLVLVATSGDTGKAALAGFSGRPGIRVLVFYPARGVSEIQRLQMATHAAPNATVIGVRGNFDDAQRGVKALFADRGLASWLSGRGQALGSANSINVGRLLPQIVYYVWAYRSAIAAGLVPSGGLLDFVVPTGNFGDALAGFYARAMGLPVGDIVVATNANRVLADFFSSGRYDRNRPFYQTTSPSMDILAASNLERFLFELLGRNASRVSSLMSSFSSSGSCVLAPAERDALARSGIRGGSANDEEAAVEIRDLFESSGYLMDTHTAVASSVASRLCQAGSGGRARPAVILSTASAFKFSGAVARSLGLAEGRDELETAALLARHCGQSLPAAVADLGRLERRQPEIIDPEDMDAAFRRWAEGALS